MKPIAVTIKELKSMIRNTITKHCSTSFEGKVTYSFDVETSDKIVDELYKKVLNSNFGTNNKYYLRMASDPEKYESYKVKSREYMREYMRKKRADPETRAKMNAKSREYQRLRRLR